MFDLLIYSFGTFLSSVCFLYLFLQFLPVSGYSSLQIRILHEQSVPEPDSELRTPEIRLETEDVFVFYFF